MTAEESRTYKRQLKELGIIVIVPTYNNAGTLAGVLQGLLEYTEDLLVVNDGSSDETSGILRQTDGIRFLEHERNRGKGQALRTGLKEAARAGFRYALTVDADGQHYPDDIPVFLEKITQTPDSLLIGARNLTADNMPGKNTFANRFSNFWFRAETGKKLSDTQSGFRLYPLEKLKGMHLIGGRYEFEVEIIVRAAWRGIPVENVPIRVYYPPEEERVSHFRPFLDFTRISLLNTLLVLGALFYYYPWRFLQSLTRENIRRFIDQQILHCPHSNARLAAAMGWGIACGILPIWGYQMLFAALSAHFMKLNPVVSLVFSNISIPPMIPFILYGSLYLGSLVTGNGIALSLSEITLKSVGLSLTQYIIGSILLAAAAGALTFLTAWSIMTVCKRGKK